MTAPKSAPDGAKETAADGLPPLREVIRRHDLSARKSLGQNFLLDLNLTGRIARAAGPLDGVTVVEIGPGPGGLTRALLAEGARRVIAIERDERALAALAEIAERYPDRLTAVPGDAMEFDPRPLLDDGPVRIVANLPYNIATPLLIGWLSAEPWPPWYDRLVLMFQREVAERLAQGPTFGYAMTKKALLVSGTNDLATQLDLERDLMSARGRSEDYREGVQAFLEKRQPRFRGR